AEQRLAEMDVGLDEAGDDEAAVAIPHRYGRGPSVRPSVRPPDRLYPPAPHGHIRALHPPCAVVQQHIAADEQQVGCIRGLLPGLRSRRAAGRWWWRPGGRCRMEALPGDLCPSSLQS